MWRTCWGLEGRHGQLTGGQLAATAVGAAATAVGAAATPAVPVVVVNLQAELLVSGTSLLSWLLP